MLYKEDFPVGSKVRIASREFLKHFERSWKYHYPLESSQLHHAGEVATVSSVGFYHGGDVVYQLRDIPALGMRRAFALTHKQARIHRIREGESKWPQT